MSKEPPPPYSPPPYGMNVGQDQPFQYQPSAPIATTLIVTASGDCPVCRVGVLREEITCFGIAMAIIFFPLGLLCLLLTQKRCSNCGSTF